MNRQKAGAGNDTSFSAHLHQTLGGKEDITNKKQKPCIPTPSGGNCLVQLCHLQLRKHHRGQALGPAVNSPDFVHKSWMCTGPEQKDWRQPQRGHFASKLLSPAKPLGIT